MLALNFIFLYTLHIFVSKLKVLTFTEDEIYIELSEFYNIMFYK